MVNGKASLWKRVTGKKETTKKSAASILDAENTTSKSKKTGGSTSSSKKSGNNTQPPQKRQQSSTASKNSGSTVEASGTNKNESPNAQIPNTKPNVTKNVYKKGGTLATLGLGAALGGIGTYLSGLKDVLFPPEETVWEYQENEDGSEDTYADEDKTVWDTLNDDAADLLEAAEDVPLIGDAVTAAEEGGWSFALLAGIVIAIIAAGVLIYKKVGKKAKTAKRRTAARKRTKPTAKRIIVVG